MKRAISGMLAVITIISFLLQIYDVFPKIQHILIPVSYALLGIIIGSVISYLYRNEVKIKEINTIQLFVFSYFILLGIAFIFLVGTLILSDDKSKASTIQTVLLCLGIFTIISASILSGNMSVYNDPTTFDEKLMLARYYHTNKNLGKAIYFYKMALKSLSEDDQRISGLNTKIEALKIEQIGHEPASLT